ncbi:DNA-binding protein, excisionase family [Desulfosporosinus acidiphilus SJ4]|uniref:DNA-binding protein, excisionase family n=1 Tax=Desulfosporosinus acidiphilus (strain DSM 22704 / JCM 16185 / SJ4) TaxID=646529 RepID=I4D5A6_DESAJ|nr:helix-turn-helix domain-containing protein [Desulfosporosinus acidiphilus]AFM40980.1 DNA-binding protein, excisionase family [Desulfosporosinus acidiphilus SJ4]
MKNETKWEDLPIMLSPIQAGKILRLNPEMVRTLAKAKAIPAIRPTSKFLIPRDALKEWIEKNSQVVE